MSDLLEEIKEAFAVGYWIIDQEDKDTCRDHISWLIAEVERLRKDLKERDAMLREFIALLEAHYEGRRECGCDWCAAVERARKMVGGK
jgi:hypothetical protein